MSHLIIGNGVAGTTAALTIRKFDRESEITIISEEAYPFYSRIRLIDYLADEVSEHDLIIFKDQWYKRNRIRLVLNTRVTSLAPGAKEVALSGGQKMTYDKLLIATGGTSFTPPIKGADKSGVFTLRTLDDAQRIRTAARTASHIIVLGGGLLGIEAGNALRKSGKNVTIVEFAPRLLPRQLDDDGADILKGMLEKRGIRFVLNARAKEVIGDTSVAGMLLEDGRQIDAAMVLISAGIRCNTSLLEGIGCKLGSGVIVDDRMETGIPDVYAAGDIIEHRGIVYGIWPAAEQQGKVAGINMAGGTALYEGTIPSNILKVAGIDLLSAGEIDAGGTLMSFTIKDGTKGIYKKLVFRDGIFTGCILCGDTEGRKEIVTALGERKTLAAMKDILERSRFKDMQTR
ncbi:MAG: NAD(P)/FAD-dependent oxidoreductase [Nitrospirota bacterium]